MIDKYSEKLDLSLGYAFTETDSQALSSSHVWNLNVNGELSPKILGSLGIGYSRFESDLGDFSDPSYLADLTWQATEGFAVKLGARTFYRTAVTGEPMRSRAALFEFQYRLENYWVATAGIGYEDLRSKNGGVSRTDDLWYAVASLQRNLVPNAFLRLSMKYEDQDSSRETFSFDRLTAEIGFKVVF